MRVRWVVAVALGVGAGSSGCVHPQSSGGGWTGSPIRSETAAMAPGAPAAKAEELPGKQSAALCLTMAESLEKDGKEADAVGYYERARQLDPSLCDRAARRLAILYDRLDDQARAMTEFQELLRKKPKDAALLNDIGYSCYNRGQWAEAEQYLRRAVAADKANKRAWVNLGMALGQQGKYTEALDAFGKAVTPAEAQANLGFILTTQGKRDDAAAAYRRALQLEPTLKVAQRALAKLEATSAEPPTNPGS
jgi:tetratricopeptide (TPR) repeat protein